MKSTQDLQNLTPAEMEKLLIGLSKKLSESLSAKTETEFETETEFGFDYIYNQAERNKKLLLEELL